MNPEPQVLRKTYSDLRKTAISINRSRGQIRADRDRQLAIVAKQENDLRAFAEQAGLLLHQKAELNKILNQYAESLETVERAGEELEGAMEDFKGGLSSWQKLFAALSKFLGFLRSSRQNARSAPKVITDGSSQ
jgi:chromosome segregation ATPase